MVHSVGIGSVGVLVLGPFATHRLWFTLWPERILDLLGSLRLAASGKAA